MTTTGILRTNSVRQEMSATGLVCFGPAELARLEKSRSVLLAVRLRGRKGQGPTSTGGAEVISPFLTTPHLCNALLTAFER
jgi:hypothetical protein